MKAESFKAGTGDGIISNCSIYHICVTVLYFLVAFSNLAIVSSVNEIKFAASLLELLCDFLLFIVYITKVRDLKGATVFISLVALCLASAWYSKSFLAIKGLLLVVGATNEDYSGILRSGAKAIFIVLIIGLCCQALGFQTSAFRRGGFP